MNTEIDLDQPWTQEFSAAVTQLDVYYFFRHILGRLPLEAEWPGHCGLVGKNLPDVVAAYLNSREFKSRKLIGFSPQGITKVELGEYAMYAAENDYSVGGHIIAQRDYEPAVSEVFRSHLKPGMAVVDIGANIGWFSLLSAALVGKTGRVFSFEPGMANSRFLMLNKAVNAFDQITLIHAAASDRIESLAYSSTLSNGSVADLTGAEPGLILNSDIVLAMPIDSIIPPDLPIHLIKVDVEGWEMKALRGAAQTIERWKPKIIAEFTPPALLRDSGLTGEEFLAYFKERGYSFEVIQEGKPLNCGFDIGRVMTAYEQSKVDHIDILMTPEGVENQPGR
jgi:FkbM family methyltransferase